jgi:hypothetical protein
MQRVILKLGLLLALLIIIDRVGGLVLKKIFYKQHHGDDYVSIATIGNKADVQILGSSRASHHFVSDTIQQHLGLSTFNGGRDMMGIHYVQAILPAVIQQHVPKIIVLDLIPNNFCLGGQSSQRYKDIHTATLLPLAAQYPSIMQYVQQYNSAEAYKSKLCASYAFNSLIGTMVQNAYTHIGHVQIKGYEPVYTTLDSSTYTKPLFNEHELLPQLDTSALSSLQNIAQLCQQNKIKLYLHLSPFYFNRLVRTQALQAINNIALQYSATLINKNSDTSYVGKAYMWYDEVHLNHTGANKLTRELCEVLYSK